MIKLKTKINATSDHQFIIYQIVIFIEFFIYWFFLKLIDSDFHYAKYFESFGGTVSLHTTTHISDMFRGGKDRWIDELSNNYKALIELALINDIDFKGGFQLTIWLFNDTGDIQTQTLFFSVLSGDVI